MWVDIISFILYACGLFLIFSQVIYLRTLEFEVGLLREELASIKGAMLAREMSDIMAESMISSMFKMPTPPPTAEESKDTTTTVEVNP